MTEVRDLKSFIWAKNIKIRDGFACRICHRNDIFLHSHHLNSYDIFIDQRYDLENGICLCFECHKNFHQVYGKGSNSKFQFQEYLKSIELIKQALSKIESK